MTPVTVSHVWLDDRGVAWIDDTNIKVIEVAQDWLYSGLTPEQMVSEHYGKPNLAQTFSALAYYHDHKAEFDAQMERADREHERRRAETMDSPGRQKAPRDGQDSMSVRPYMDVHIRNAAIVGLRRRGVGVLTAQEDNSGTLSDPELLDRATGSGRVLVSEDEDFLVETDRRLHAGEPFAGWAYTRQRLMTIRQLINDLELIAKVYDPQDMVNRVEYLPF